MTSPQGYDAAARAALIANLASAEMDRTPGADVMYLHDAAFHMATHVAREVLARADHAMHAQGVDEPTRDEVLRTTLTGAFDRQQPPPAVQAIRLAAQLLDRTPWPGATP
jgi:hypothetical protein